MIPTLCLTFFLSRLFHLPVQLSSNETTKAFDKRMLSDSNNMVIKSIATLNRFPYYKEQKIISSISEYSIY